MTGTLLDESVLVMHELDFEEPCIATTVEDPNARCPNTPTWEFFCGYCGHHGAFCDFHHDDIVRLTADAGFALQCNGCGKDLRTNHRWEHR